MDEMRVEAGVNESVKKKLVRSTWAGHVDKMGDEKMAESRCPERGGNWNVMGNCIKSYLERVGEEWKKRQRRNWRLLTENVITINEMKKKENRKGIHAWSNLFYY